MYKLDNPENAKRFLQGLGLHIDEAVVRRVINVLSGKAPRSLYSLYATRPDKPPPDCGKGTAYKIKKLYDRGELKPYLAYLSRGPTVGEAEAEQVKETEHEQKPHEETRHEQEAEGREKLVALVQKWRLEVASYSPVNLLQGWLDKASEDALARFYTNKDVEMLYSEARRPHTEPLHLKRGSLQVEDDPTFGLLRQKFPASDVWAVFQAWCEQRIPYVQAFYHMLKKLAHVVANALDTAVLDTVASAADKEVIKRVDWIDGSSFPAFVKKCKMERLLTVFVTCDLLAHGIASLPSNTYWEYLTNDLKKLRLRINVELSSVTAITSKGGWSSGIMEVRAQRPNYPLKMTRAFLSELIKLQSAEKPLATALQELEARI